MDDRTIASNPGRLSVQYLRYARTSILAGRFAAVVVAIAARRFVRGFWWIPLLLWG